MKLPKPRFRLAMLFALVTGICVLVWVFWTALPEWRAYQRRLKFEHAVAQLKAGQRSDCRRHQKEQGDDTDGQCNLALQIQSIVDVKVFPVISTLLPFHCANVFMTRGRRIIDLACLTSTS